MSIFGPIPEEWVVVDLGYGVRMLLTSEHGHPECKDGVAWVDSEGKVVYEGICLPDLTEMNIVNRGWTNI